MDVCLPLAGHIPDLGCDKVGIRAGLEVDDGTHVHLAADPLSVTDVTMG